jgi:hypothetical protein
MALQISLQWKMQLCCLRTHWQQAAWSVISLCVTLRQSHFAERVPCCAGTSLWAFLWHTCSMWLSLWCWMQLWWHPSNLLCVEVCYAVCVGAYCCIPAWVRGRTNLLSNGTHLPVGGHHLSDSQQHHLAQFCPLTFLDLWISNQLITSAEMISCNWLAVHFNLGKICRTSVDDDYFAPVSWWWLVTPCVLEASWLVQLQLACMRCWEIGQSLPTP